MSGAARECIDVARPDGAAAGVYTGAPGEAVTTEATADRGSRPYFRHLPGWMYDAPEYAALGAAERWIIHRMMARAYAVDTLGNAAGVCGVDLIRECACASSTFWAAYGRLEAAGLSVTIGRGSGRLANSYSIPQARGAADALRVRRRTATVPGDAPRRVLRRASVRNPETSGAEGAASVRESDGCRPKSGRLPSENRTPAVRESDTTYLYSHHSISSLSPSPAASGGEARPAAAGGGGGGGVQVDGKAEGAEGEREAAVVEALAVLGVSPAKRRTLAAIPGLTAEAVRSIARKVRASGGQAGAIVRAIEADGAGEAKRLADEAEGERIRAEALAEQRAKEKRRAERAEAIRQRCGELVEALAERSGKAIGAASAEAVEAARKAAAAKWRCDERRVRILAGDRVAPGFEVRCDVLRAIDAGAAPLLDELADLRREYAELAEGGGR